MPRVRAKTKHNLSWSQADRVRLFERMVEGWGTFASWKGIVTPGTPLYKEDLKKFGKEFGRSPGSIKAQMLAAITTKPSYKNNKSILQIKEAATEAGFINGELEF
jgi:hypothetical protein